MAPSSLFSLSEYLLLRVISSLDCYTQAGARGVCKVFDEVLCRFQFVMLDEAQEQKVAEFCTSRQGLVLESVIEMTAVVRVDEMFGSLFCVHAIVSPVCKTLKKLTLSLYTFSVIKEKLDWNMLLSILRQCKQLESLGIETEADFDLVGKLPSP
jgi:hypothetical protein